MDAHLSILVSKVNGVAGVASGYLLRASCIAGSQFAVGEVHTLKRAPNQQAIGYGCHAGHLAGPTSLLCKRNR